MNDTLILYLFFSYLFMLGARMKDENFPIILIILSPIILPVALGFRSVYED